MLAAAGSPKLTSQGSPKLKAAKEAKLVASFSDAKAAQLKPATASREDNLTYDLRHLAAFDIAPLNAKTNFLAYTRDSVQLLMNKVYALPTKQIEEGNVVILPDQEVFRLPRYRPIPKTAPKTRWTKFMEDRNMKKRKRSRLVFDEVSGDWKPRWGYKSVKKEGDKANNWAHEVKAGENPFDNPFEKQNAEKKLLVARQKMREVRNKVEALGGKMKAAAPNLVGADGGPRNRGNTGRGKDGLKEAVKRAQTSSGSFGKFDRIAPGEATNLQSKKRKGIGAQSASQEKERYLKQVSRVFNGDGGIDRNKAAKLGAQAEATAGHSAASRGKVGKTSKRRSKQGGKGKKRR